jgi:hypothetical protein
VNNLIPRLIAFSLSLGSILWGGFLCILVPFLVGGDSGGFLVFVLAPSYLVMVGYICRAAFPLALRLRQFIWVGSILVQGAWLVWGVGDNVFAGQWNRVFEPPVLVGWWCFAFGSSAVALAFETQSSYTAEKATPLDAY